MACGEVPGPDRDISLKMKGINCGFSIYPVPVKLLSAGDDGLISPSNMHTCPGTYRSQLFEGNRLLNWEFVYKGCSNQGV